MKKTAINLTDGLIWWSIITFAIPIVISNIFQQLYNTADIMIVGRFLAGCAAASGRPQPSLNWFVGSCTGVGNGMGVIIARYHGANNHASLKRAVPATIVIGAVLSPRSSWRNAWMYPLLEFLGTPRYYRPVSCVYPIIVPGIAGDVCV